MPPRLPGYDCSVCFQPCRKPSHALGSLTLSENSVALWALDFGHSADITPMVAAIESELATSPPGRALAGVNSWIFRSAADRVPSFYLLIVMVIDRSDHTLSYASAGFGGPILRSSQNEFNICDQSHTGLPLGVGPNSEYSTHSVQLAPQTSVIWVSPYTTQIMNAQSELFAPRGLQLQIRAAPQDPAQFVAHLEADIQQFAGPGAPNEDICIFCVRRIEGIRAT